MRSRTRIRTVQKWFTAWWLEVMYGCYSSKTGHPLFSPRGSDMLEMGVWNILHRPHLKFISNNKVLILHSLFLGHYTRLNIPLGRRGNWTGISLTLAKYPNHWAKACSRGLSPWLFCVKLQEQFSHLICLTPRKGRWVPSCGLQTEVGASLKPGFRCWSLWDGWFRTYSSHHHLPMAILGGPT